MYINLVGTRYGWFLGGYIDACFVGLCGLRVDSLDSFRFLVLYTELGYLPYVVQYCVLAVEDGGMRRVPVTDHKRCHAIMSSQWNERRVIGISAAGAIASTPSYTEP